MGFAAETENLVANAIDKRTRKGCDWIVANDVSPATGTFGGERNTVHLITAEGVQDWPTLAKDEVALRLAGVANPTIELARETVRGALADQLAARALLLPSVNVGANYRLHRGTLLAPQGFVRDVNLQSAYLGAGAGVTGGGTAATLTMTMSLAVAARASAIVSCSVMPG